MKTYFDEATDKRLLEAQTEEEVKAIIAETPEAEKLADKTNLVMAEIARIKGTVDNEIDIEELDNAAGGAKRQRIDLSPSQGCIATFFARDGWCYSNDQCFASNEYEYHHIRYSNCKKGGKHDWSAGSQTYKSGGAEFTTTEVYKCSKCGVIIDKYGRNFDD
ncbi:MAG: hypothetical protein IJ645_05000 [Ruminococcus sp.]|nr:hypothetical protein [Ruminococcus sp.]